jgi:hypothetical protein
MENARMSGGPGSHDELTVVYDKETGEIVHVHLFSSYDGSSLSAEVKEQLALESATHRFSRKKPARAFGAVGTLHVGTNALVPGHAYQVDLKTATIIERPSAK